MCIVLFYIIIILIIIDTDILYVNILLIWMRAELLTSGEFRSNLIALILQGYLTSPHCESTWTRTSSGASSIPVGKCSSTLTRSWRCCAAYARTVLPAHPRFGHGIWARFHRFPSRSSSTPGPNGTRRSTGSSTRWTKRRTSAVTPRSENNRAPVPIVRLHARLP